MLELDEIDHIQLTVSDIPRAAAWYRDVLGFADDGEWNDGAQYKHIKAGRSQITLGVPQHEPPHVAFCVSTEQLRDVRAALAERGIASRDKTNAYADMLYFADPDGNVIELFSWRDR
jgi:catechol-2,3-dioxygenase